jgi:hypothetical protein
MPPNEIQIEIYALTKQLMDLSDKYILETGKYEKIFLLERINTIYAKLNILEIEYRGPSP